MVGFSSIHLSKLLHLPPPHIRQAIIHGFGTEHEVLDEVDVDVVDVELVPAASDKALELLLEDPALLLQHPHALNGGHHLKIAAIR